MMEGKLVGMELEAKTLRTRMDGMCSLIRSMLNTSLTLVEEIDYPAVAVNMRELELAGARHLILDSKISHIKKELGRG
jgi:hypothetical protein